MTREPDPIDGALRLLADQSWPSDRLSVETENRLMQSFEANKSSGPVRRHRHLIAVLAFVVLGGAAFAAAGGVQMVMDWFITVSVEVDGELVATETLAVDEDGNATMPLPPGALEGAEELTFTISDGEVPVDDLTGSGTATVNVAIEDDAAHLNVQVEADDADE
jgi:hypothetical protein